MDRPDSRDSVSSEDRRYDRVYDELRRIAGGYLAQEKANHTLQPTALVHEAYIRLAKEGGDTSGDAHFRAIAARAMRQLLIEHARKRGAQKRGGDRRQLTLVTGIASTGNGIDVLELEEALEKLAALDERLARVVELRFYGGLTIDECAEEIGVAATVVKDDWRTARALLADMLGDAV